LAGGTGIGRRDVTVQGPHEVRHAVAIVSEKRGWTLTEFMEMDEEDLSRWLKTLNEIDSQRLAAMDANDSV
jgi:hypothetical protein